MLAHAIGNVDVQQCDQDVGGDIEDDGQGSQNLEVIFRVCLQPVHGNTDDPVGDEKNGDQ